MLTTLSEERGLSIERDLSKSGIGRLIDGAFSLKSPFKFNFCIQQLSPKKRLQVI